MTILKWNDDWNLGVEKIDSQHKQLIYLVNKSGLPNIKLDDLVVEFIDYTGSHFKDEELLMIENGYDTDLYDTHKEEHLNFVTSLLEISFIQDLNDNKHLAIKFKEFCITWFKTHLLKTDIVFAEFLKGGNRLDNK